MRKKITFGIALLIIGIITVIWPSDNMQAESKINNRGVLALSDINFESTISEYNLIVVEFWHPDCSHCQKMIPIFEEFSTEYGDKIAFGTLNVQDNRRVPEKYQIEATPSFLLFENREPIDLVVGANEESVESLLQKYQ